MTVLNSSTGFGFTFTNEALTDAATITPNSNSNGGTLTSLSQGLTVNAPSPAPLNKRSYTLDITSAASQALTFNAVFEGSGLLPLPTATSGGGQTDVFLFTYISAKNKWILTGDSPGYA